MCLKSAVPMVFGLPLTLAPYVFVVAIAYVSIHGASFSLLFSKLSKL